MKGFVFILGNIIVASLQSVLLSYWLKGINVFLVMSMSFSIVLLLYSSLFLLKGRHFVEGLKSMKKEILLLNMVSACNWIFYFFAIKFINPAAVVTITQCMPAVFTSLFLVVSGKKVTVTTLFFHTLILLCTIFLVQDYISRDSGIQSRSITGIGIALLCAMTVAMTIGVSRTFSERKIPSYVVLALRFPFLIVISWSLTPLVAVQNITLYQVYIILFVSIVGLAMANFFLQKGIEYATPLMVSTTLTISPAVVLLFDKINRHDYLMTTQSFTILFIVFLSLSCIYLNNRRTSAQMVHRQTS
ncbi:hypothetical protein [Gynuella sp.]|uniref:hypothetical protein n=1 Tax=Gynuella sp. TaxID=2969146 RepID=UPI003D0F3FEC